MSTHRPTPAMPSGVRTRQRGGRVTQMIRNHPVGAFFVWFFTVGQALAFTPVIARELYNTELIVQPFIVASTLLGLLLPTIVITHIVDGSEGTRRLWQSISRVQVSPLWYAVAIVLVPLATLAITVALFGLPAGATASTIGRAVLSGLVLQTLLVFASNNLWEEVAWMGFVQARLQARHGPMRAAAITGPLFALQHISLMFGNPLVVGVIIMVVFAIVAIPFRALLGWAYNSTGSLFIVGLIHAVGNGLTAGSGFFAAGLLPRLYTNDVVGVMHLLSSAVIGLVVIAATRGRLAGGNAARVPPAPSNVASAQT